MEQQVWSIQLARQSTLRPRVAVPSPHRAFQEHAAHPIEGSMKLSSKGSSGTCILEVFYDIPPYCFHGAAAHLRRMLLIEQQVWSILHARQSPL